MVLVPAASSRLSSSAIYASSRVANRPIASQAVCSLVTAGVHEIAIVGPLAELAEVRDCIEDDKPDAASLTYIVQEQRRDLLGAIMSVESFVAGRPVIAHLADGLLGQQLDGLVYERALSEMPDLLLLLHRSEDSRRGLALATQRLLGLTELDRPGDRLSLAGVFAFGPGALSRAAETPPKSDRTDLVAIAEHLADQGGELEAEVVLGWHRYRGDPDDLLALNRVVLDRQVVANDVLNRGDNRIEGRVVIHPTAVVRASIILGPCIIGPHARVEDSYIGPYTAIGARAQIDGTEIVRSIVAEDVRIRHVGGRIEGSTIGRHAKIFRDFALPRAMRLHVGEGVEVALN